MKNNGIQHFYCDVCHKEFSSQAGAYAHEDATYQAAIEANDMSLIHAGHFSVEEYIDQGYYEAVVAHEAYDETVIDQPAWERVYLSVQWLRSDQLRVK